MPRIPRDRSFDSSLALRRNPYGFVSERCRRFGTDLFQSRLLLQKTIFLTGPEAAAIFYDHRRFIRAGAAPEPLRATLFGKGGVQNLDDEAHRSRKAMFLSLVPPARVRALADVTAELWPVA